MLSRRAVLSVPLAGLAAVALTSCEKNTDPTGPTPSTPAPTMGSPSPSQLARVENLSRVFNPIPTWSSTSADLQWACGTPIIFHAGRFWGFGVKGWSQPDVPSTGYVFAFDPAAPDQVARGPEMQCWTRGATLTAVGDEVVLTVSVPQEAGAVVESPITVLYRLSGDKITQVTRTAGAVIWRGGDLCHRRKGEAAVSKVLAAGSWVGLKPSSAKHTIVDSFGGGAKRVEWSVDAAGVARWAINGSPAQFGVDAAMRADQGPVLTAAGAWLPITVDTEPRLGFVPWSGKAGLVVDGRPQTLFGNVTRAASGALVAGSAAFSADGAGQSIVAWVDGFPVQVSSSGDVWVAGRESVVAGDGFGSCGLGKMPQKSSAVAVEDAQDGGVTRFAWAVDPASRVGVLPSLLPADVAAMGGAPIPLVLVAGAPSSG